MKQLVIFDLDGTLLNTISDLGAATNHALATLGFPTHPLEAYPMMVGNGVRKLLERALPAEQRNDGTLERAFAAFHEYYKEHLWDHTTVYPGISELLDDLMDRNIAAGVTSNKYQEAVTRLINHFFPDIPWIAVIGQREGIPVKPDPSIVFDVISQNPTPKADILYCGDSGVDMETARRAGVESCGVTWGFRSRAELEEYRACVIVDSPGEILNCLTTEW